jgi:hypothetical protein
MNEIPTADWTWINAAGDRFERAWKDGPRPKIEDYLAEVEKSRRLRLLENRSTSRLRPSPEPLDRVLAARAADGGPLTEGAPIRRTETGLQIGGFPAASPASAR